MQNSLRALKVFVDRQLEAEDRGQVTGWLPVTKR